MAIIYKLSSWISELRDAKNAGLTNDASVMRFFMVEYKKDPIGAYEYWISNHKLPSSN